MGYSSLRSSFEISKRDIKIQTFLWTAVNFLILLIITLEVLTFFDARIFLLSDQESIGGIYKPLSYQYDDSQYRSLYNQRNAAISVFWTLYAILLMAIGMVTRSAYLRWSSLILFGVTIIKVFLIDLSGLQTPYRIISFMALGVILLLASFLYFKYEKNLSSQK